MKNLNYRVIIRKEPEGSYTAIVPTLKGCITWGETIEEAMKMAKEAIEVMIESMQAKGLEIPDDSETVEYSVNVPNLQYA
ncbi:type II toxin-antitoxin system HicB family antitoxin [Runella sp.]|jgi:antitoxin HicB|uniref:type II toxin-antitoxin system HicB family antitoxin n=1 Tax=Runella sp. TaxID=1960881 RepID=UPI002601CB03|nr:type II toxin-antitoxin system HicB family antitoxin [Runella sp.]